MAFVRTLRRLKPTGASRSDSSPMWGASGRSRAPSNYVSGSMRGGVPRIYYGWMAPGSLTRRRFEKMRNPFVDLDSGTSIYYRATRDPVEALRQEADVEGVRGGDNVDLQSAYRVVPDLYPEGFQWKHKLNTEYSQWRSNTWMTPDLIPQEHRGRFLCSFQLNVIMYDMRVAKFSPKDARQWVLCSLYVGSGKGIAGHGTAVAPSSAEAKKEAIRNAFSNIVAVNLEDEGPLYPIRINHEGVRVCLYPARSIVANFLLADVLCAFGFTYAGVRINTHHRQKPRNLGSRVDGLIKCVSMMRTSTEMAHARGKIPSSLVSNMFPYLEEVRRRKGMFAMHPKGIDAANFSSNRTVDNRMPDHLKKNYYDDKYWKDFFAGAPGRLNEPKIGMRGDELRALVPPTNERLSADMLARRRSTKRRTLSDVLNKANRHQQTLGSLPIANPYSDMKLTTHVKTLFHLH